MMGIEVQHVESSATAGHGTRHTAGSKYLHGKRSLLKYGWSAPLIVAVSLPKSGFAAKKKKKKGSQPKPKPKPKY
jgi:hypothetical protein